MMSLSGLYLLFFAIAVGAFAPTEASSAPAAVNPATASSPVTFALLADQHQQNNSTIPVQKESPLGPLDQRKIRLANILATAGATAAILFLAFIFMKGAKQMKGFLEKEREEDKEKLRPEDMVDQPKKKAPKPKPKPKKLPKLTDEQELLVEIDWIGSAIGFDEESKTEAEIRQEAKERLEKRKQEFEKIRYAAGAEGKTEEDLKRKAETRLAFQRDCERGKIYGYDPTEQPFEQWIAERFNPEWERRQEIALRLFGEDQ